MVAKREYLIKQPLLTLPFICTLLASEICKRNDNLFLIDIHTCIHIYTHRHIYTHTFSCPSKNLIFPSAPGF